MEKFIHNGVPCPGLVVAAKYSSCCFLQTDFARISTSTLLEPVLLCCFPAVFLLVYLSNMRDQITKSIQQHHPLLHATNQDPAIVVGVATHSDLNGGELVLLCNRVPSSTYSHATNQQEPCDRRRRCCNVVRGLERRTCFVVQ
jgi:hypothetical protein